MRPQRQSRRAPAPTVDPQPFRPVLRGLLLTGSTPRYMRAEVSGGRGEDWRVSDHALWWPPSKIAGKRLAPYLALRHDELETEPDGLHVDVDVPATEDGAVSPEQTPSRQTR